ncbi:hypothetical protein D9756_000046 [Leucocoprinus leucothites]|uniref:Uncharacterized protein n=1 Tax=Leucocoprinus leucothites TaxID=201217 RepID=A0A8H5GFF7_9AGAR|nr:hypothetical protein D9756_000046 [Leucoagaricus leucothites]
MPEYVYALHDFLPENEDEVTFSAGERIEVVEKDDMYGDGWWQGRNLLGKVGLFPVSYTTPAPPTATISSASLDEDSDSAVADLGQKTVLNTLPEESESGSPRPEREPTNIIAPIPKAAPAHFLNGNHHDFGASDEVESSRPPGDEVMKATLTDVQQAIEQLGRNRGDNDDGGRSFSFASTRDDRGTDTDTDFDLSDLDGGPGGVNGDDVEGWHKGARFKLAEKARRAVEEAEKLEAMMGGLNNSGERRTVAPPIEVELSDESEDEMEREGYTTRTTSSAFQGIPEEDENDLEVDRGGTSNRGKNETASGTPIPPDGAVSFTLPPKDEAQQDTATATQTTFPAPSPPIHGTAIADLSPATQSPEPQSSTRLSASSIPTSTHTSQDDVKSASPVPATEHAPTSTPMLHESNAISSLTPPPPVVPAPASPPFPRAMSPATTTTTAQSKHASVASANSHRSSLQHHVSLLPAASPEPTSPLPPIPGSLMPTQTVPTVFSVQPVNSTATANTVGTTATSTTGVTIVTAATTVTPLASPPLSTVASPTSTPAPVIEGGRKEKTHPSEWTMEEVVEWLRSKGFDQDVCDKFIEQDITGDVLLELDANLLKSEIGIMAFGKRVRISNAIAELRRPPSISYSDHQMPTNNTTAQGEGSPMVMHTPITPQSQVHSRTQSQSHSHHSFPGSGPSGVGGHQYSQSIQSSLGSPLGFGGPGNGMNGFNNTAMQPGLVGGFAGNVPTPLVESPSQDYVTVTKPDGDVDGGVGLGISDSSTHLKPRPAHLALSPSDGALKSSATADSVVRSAKGAGGDEVEDRGHMSDGEIVPASSMRRRLFGRSHDSTIRLRGGEGEREGGEGSVSSTRHKKGKRSVDGGRSGGERLSIFGGTFGGSLTGKGRKPPPSASQLEEPQEKSSMFSLPRLGSSSMRKSSSTSNRPSTPTGGTSPTNNSDFSPRHERNKTLKERESTLLRKRTTSSGANGNGNGNGAAAAAMAGATAAGVGVSGATGLIKPGQSILDQIGQPDHVGWMRKRGDRYNSWKNRYFVLKGPHMYCLRSDSKSETKIKGYIHIVGYKVSVDENLDPGRYCFRVDHENDKSHYFSSDEKAVVRDWMKAIMKATIDRDYSKPVVSSCNIPTIPLTVAQAMNPAPRPPSPTARAATQKALRRENPNQLSSRDAQILMGLSSSSSVPMTADGKDGRPRLESLFANQDVGTGSASVVNKDTPAATSTTGAVAAKLSALNAGPAPPRPSREMRRTTSIRSSVTQSHSSASDDILIEWANSHLPPRLQITDPSGSLCSGLALLRLAESIKGKPASPPVPDSAFPVDASDDKLDGLFRLFDYLLDNDVKMGNVSINDVRQGKRDKIVQLLKALRGWEEKRRAIAQSFGKGGVQAAGFIALV